MNIISRIMIVLGIVFIVTGVLVRLAPNIPWLGKLPGDIHIKSEDFSFYLPLTTCIIISIAISLILYIWGKR